jgi:diguanylate cyclase (GGDEF)-like protein
VQEQTEHLDGLFPIIGIAGRHLGQVHMHWQRVQRIQQDLPRILAQQDWSGEVKASGRDEIAELARFVNAMMAVRDALTAMANRRKFDEHMQRARAQFQGDQTSGALILLGVDYFKRFNDLNGHPAGDQVLMQIAQCLQTAARRPIDLAARLGGEEFALLLEHTDVTGARACAERARGNLLQAVIMHAGNPSVGFVTLSAGIALFRQGDTPDAIYARADAALYAAKAAGRNRSVVG